MDIFTIGYEGADISTFIEALEKVGVSHIIDIRELPASRRRDFSKNILRENLRKFNISYSHFKALGDPKEGRDAMRRGDRATFLQVFSERMASEETQRALAEVTNIALNETSALLCYERDPKSCHRSIVAAEMVRNKAFVVCHLGVHSHSRGKTVGAHVQGHQPAC